MVQEGVHVLPTAGGEISGDMLKVLKSQDAKYVNMKAQTDKKVSNAIGVVPTAPGVRLLLLAENRKASIQSAFHRGRSHWKTHRVCQVGGRCEEIQT